jgi:hypothetical protein
MVISDDGILVAERHYYKKRDQNEISKSLKDICIKNDVRFVFTSTFAGKHE